MLLLLLSIIYHRRIPPRVCAAVDR